MDDLVGKGVSVLDDDLRRGRQADFARLLKAPLSFNVKIVEVGDLVAPELRADRIFRIGHEEVEDAAAQRELTAALHRIEPLVAEQRQGTHGAVEVERLALPQRENGIRKHVLRNRELARRVDAGDHNVAFLLHDFEQHLEPRVLILARGALKIEKAVVPDGIDESAQSHAAEVVAQRLRFLFVRRDTERGRTPAVLQRKYHVRLADRRESRDAQRPACF